VRAADYRAVLVLGGRAPEYLRHDPRVIELVREFDRQEKWIFGICHGVQILAAAGLVAGKRVTAYTNCRWEIEAAGGRYITDDQAVCDGRMVTGQTWQSHPEFYRLVFECLR
jgi:protease I